MLRAQHRPAAPLPTLRKSARFVTSIPPNDAFFQQHLARLKARLSPDQQINSNVDVIDKAHNAGWQAFSLKHFSFQEHILKHSAPIKIVHKAAQIGLTELSMREAVKVAPAVLTGWGLDSS